jgi:hypothetical protein
MTKHLYILFAAFGLLMSPLSISAQNGCAGVSLTGNTGNITVTGLGPYSHIQVFTQYYAGQVYNQELRVSSVVIPITTGSGNYIVKVWSNPNTADFCERDFPVVVPTGVGNLPVAVNDATTTPQNTPVNIPVLTNDQVNGTLQSVTLVSNPSNGTVILNGANEFVYTPNLGFSGTDQFTYRITNQNGTSNVATVTITVPNGVSPPIAVNDNGTTPQNTPISTPVLNNDNLNGAPLQMLIVMSHPTNGTAIVSGNNIVYTPNTGFCGPDAYTYKIVTAGGSSIATVNINVTCPAPLPVANNDATTTPQNTPVNIAVLTNDQVNGTLQSVILVSNPLNGTVSLNSSNQFVYTPNLGFSGTDQFTYRITNQNGTSNVATVTITVPRTAILPLTVNDAATTPQDIPVTISVLSNDQINGTLQSVILVSPPSNGTVILNASNQFVYTPNAGFTGTDQFTYRITNQDGTSNVATVTIFVPSSDPCVVSPVPVPTATTTNATNGQANGCINITNLPTGASSSINGGAATTDRTQYCDLAAGTYTVIVNRNGCIKTASFSVANAIVCDNVTNGGTISKSCLNGTVVLNNVTAAAGGSGALQYIWLVSTTGCPTQVSQAIPNATGASLTCTPSSVTRYFVRYARRANCASATFYRASNCITVNPLECATTSCTSTQTDRCVTISLLRIQRHTSGEACLSFKVTNNCSHNLANVAISLPAGVRAANGTVYTSPSGNTYNVLNPATVPFYGIRFDATSGYIASSKSEIFTFNMPANVAIPSNITVATKCGVLVYTVNLTTNCTTNIQALNASTDRLEMNATGEPNSARIEWMSNTGEKNDYFTVEKANLTTGEFETLETVNNKVFDNSAAHYVTYDHTLTDGENTYRVKSTYTDGSVKISAPQTVNFKNAVGTKIYPNPTAVDVNVDLSKYNGKTVTVSLYNSLGNEVVKQIVTNSPNTLTINVSELPAGNYRLRVSSPNTKDAVQSLIIAQ